MAATPIATFIKDPDAVLDYGVDWFRWLDGDTISTSSWSVSAGLTAGTTSHSNGIATIFLSGGTDGTDYTVRNRVVTAGGRTVDRTFAIQVREQ